MSHPLTVSQLHKLHALAREAQGPYLVNAKHPERGPHFIEDFDALVAWGYARAHRSSIGEIDERAMYLITEKGKLAVSGSDLVGWGKTA